VVGYLEAALRRNSVLALFNAVVVELLDTPAVHTDDMVVVLTAVQFEDGHAALEMVP
jgi:hypothetical protein